MIKKPIALDIETTGLGPDAVITVVGVYSHRGLVQFTVVTDVQDYLNAFDPREYKLVTWNGAGFDLPFLARYGIDLSRFEHVDLMLKQNAIDAALHGSNVKYQRKSDAVQFHGIKTLPSVSGGQCAQLGLLNDKDHRRIEIMRHNVLDLLETISLYEAI